MNIKFMKAVRKGASNIGLRIGSARGNFEKVTESTSLGIFRLANKT